MSEPSLTELQNRIKELEDRIEELQSENVQLAGEQADAVIDRDDAERLIDVLLGQAQDLSSTALGPLRNIGTVIEALEHGFLRSVKT